MLKRSSKAGCNRSIRFRALFYVPWRRSKFKHDLGMLLSTSNSLSGRMHLSDTHHRIDHSPNSVVVLDPALSASEPGP